MCIYRIPGPSLLILQLGIRLPIPKIHKSLGGPHKRLSSDHYSCLSSGLKNFQGLKIVKPTNQPLQLGGPYTAVNNPNSRYIFRDLECGVKCVALSDSLSPRLMNDQISVCPHTTLHTPNSRYIFRDFE